MRRLEEEEEGREEQEEDSRVGVILGVMRVVMRVVPRRRRRVLLEREGEGKGRVARRRSLGSSEFFRSFSRSR